MKKVKKKLTLGEVDFDSFKEYLDSLLDQKLDQKIEEKQLVTKEDIKNIPTKKEFFDRMDTLSKEIADDREERAVSSQQSSSHEERITNLENIHLLGKHPHTT